MKSDSQSLSSFKRDTKRSLAQTGRTGRPIVLTENGRARGVVLSPAVFARLSAAQEYMETVTAVRRALDDPRPGIPLERFKTEMRARMAAGSAKPRRGTRSSAA